MGRSYTAIISSYFATRPFLEIGNLLATIILSKKIFKNAKKTDLKTI